MDTSVSFTKTFLTFCQSFQNLWFSFWVAKVSLLNQEVLARRLIAELGPGPLVLAPTCPELIFKSRHAGPKDFLSIF